MATDQASRSTRGGVLVHGATAPPTAAIASLAVLALALTLTTDSFATSSNFQVVTRDVAITLLIGLSQMVILGIGGLNLSVGAVGALTSVVIGGAMTSWGMPVPVAVLAALATGIACGVVNGLIVASGRLSPFVVTLATGSVFTGIGLAVTESKPFYGLPTGFRSLGASAPLGIPLVFLVAALVAVALWLLFRYLSLGRQILAIGANEHAAQLAGVPMKRTQVIAYALSGLIAAIAAVLLVARLGNAPPTVGNDWLLLSFAVPIIGGTRLAGGWVSVVGVVCGALLLGTLTNGLVQWNVDSYYVALVSGLIVLFAAAADRIRGLVDEAATRRRRQA